jgi:hypothetical protein
MMLVQTSLQEIPTVGKTTCLAARVHNHVKVENIPFTGVLDTITSFIKDNEELSRFISFLKDTQPDFRPGKKAASPFLDDAMQLSFEEYVGESVYSFRTYNTRGDRAYKQNNEEVFNTLLNEEGDAFSEQDNIMIVQFNNPMERTKWKRKLPALLHSLHNKGKLYGISTLSCVRAMAFYRSQGKNVQDMTPGHFISYGVYKMDNKTGECTEKLEQNSGLFQSSFQHWLLGKRPDMVYRDLIEFMNICEKANIDLVGLDPREYGESYIRTLITAYITPNKELVRRETQSQADKAVITGSNISHDILRSINSISLSKYLSGQNNSAGGEQLQNTAISPETDIISMVKSSQLWAQPEITELSAHLYKITKNLDFINGVFIDGVYCTKDSNIKPINAEQVIRVSTKTLGSRAILFSTGHFVLITRNSGGFLYIPFSLFEQYFKTKDDPEKSVVSFNLEKGRKGYEWGEWIAYDFN